MLHRHFATEFCQYFLASGPPICSLPLSTKSETAGVSGWISDSYCNIKPLWSGMGEAVPARTSPTLHPPSPRTVL